jgi:superfamily II DNA/RNA helicase
MFLSCTAIHGDRSQQERDHILNQIKSGASLIRQKLPLRLHYSSMWPKSSSYRPFVIEFASFLPQLRAMEINLGRRGTSSRSLASICQLLDTARIDSDCLIYAAAIHGNKPQQKRHCRLLKTGYNDPVCLFYTAAIHGDKSQQERDYVLNQFRSGRLNVLVATDVAARGLDVKDIEIVVNYGKATSCLSQDG